jgi:hypothetical protein
VPARGRARAGEADEREKLWQVGAHRRNNPRITLNSQLSTLDPAEIAAARASFPAALAAELPPAFAATLAAAVAQERRDGSGRDELLLRHYFELMPAMRAEQLDPARAPQAALFHAPLDLARMPRLAGALARLYALLARSGVPAERALPAGSPDELVARFPSIAAIYRETYYGAFMPLLYGYPADVARAARDLERAPVHEVLDRHLAAPVIHELSHLGRRRDALLPLYLDECVAAHVGVLSLPELAWPAPGEDNALYATPWFSQVGQALARAVGLEALVRAHAGVAGWEHVLPAGFLAGARRLGWEDYLERRGPHFLSDNFHPDPWLKLVYLARQASRAELDELPWRDVPVPPERDDDVDVIADALRSMCLDNFQEAGSFRARLRAPVDVELDLEGCRATAAGGPFDPPRLAHHLPPAWARRRARETGAARLAVRLDDPGAIPALAAVLRHVR